jgi:hypothetical protein
VAGLGIIVVEDLHYPILAPRACRVFTSYLF